MLASRFSKSIQVAFGNQFSTLNNVNSMRVGFIGLGHMGSKMVQNIVTDGHNVNVYDINSDVSNNLSASNPEKIHSKESIGDIAKSSDIVFSMLPNDAIVTTTSDELLKHADLSNFVHVSCSTISPRTSRSLQTQYENIAKNNTTQFIASPVFARPDGIARKEAIFMVAGQEYGKSLVKKLLDSAGRIEDYGSDAGAANVVKLCGNFMIAASIEAIGEASVLAEKNGVDSKEVIKLLTSTIFDCLIYKGYGHRVSQRDHRPGGFSLTLGLKDVSLVNQAARTSEAPMPFLSVLVDRFTSAKAKGRGDFDWSGVGLNIAEDAGIDVTADVKRTEKDVKDGNMY